VVEVLDPDRNAARLTELGYPPDGGARAYVCVGERCLEPASEPDELAARIREAATEPSPPAPAPAHG